MQKVEGKIKRYYSLIAFFYFEVYILWEISEYWIVISF